jgi:Domain of unknown function (DUF5667)
MSEWWGQMPRSADDRSELFAQAVEARADRPAVDDELERELAVVRMLVHAAPAAAPDDAAKQRMRDRVLAGFDAELKARADAETEATPAPAVNLDQRRKRRASHARRRTSLPGVHGRLLGAAAAALCLLLSLSGMSLVLARDALPGDALYGVKRSAESAELGLTFGDESRGFKHLQFATARVDEIEALAARAGSTPNPDPARYLTALQAFDTDAAAGSRLLIESATNDTGEQLDALGSWAAQQRQRLADARPAMPERAASRADGSIGLLQRVSDRVAALQQRLACQTVTSEERDDLGRLPADGACEPVTTGPRASVPVGPQGEPGSPVQSPANVTIPGEAPGVGGAGGAGAGSGGAGGAGSGGATNPLNPLGPVTGLNGPGVPTGGEQSRSGQPAEGASGNSVQVPLPVGSQAVSVPPLLPGGPVVPGVTDITSGN